MSCGKISGKVIIAVPVTRGGSRSVIIQVLRGCVSRALAGLVPEINIRKAATRET